MPLLYKQTKARHQDDPAHHFTVKLFVFTAITHVGISTNPTGQLIKSVCCDLMMQFSSTNAVRMQTGT